MIKWWFAWHSLEDLRYMLWFRKGHYGISVNDEDRAKILDAEVPILEKKLWSCSSCYRGYRKWTRRYTNYIFITRRIRA